MSHLLVTNDFPPKMGGIQSYLWELWRRLDPGGTTVMTTPHPDASAWDAEQPYRVERTRERPLPSGQVTLKGALAFLALQGIVGLLVLLQFNGFAIATGFASLGVVALYPFMKRFFWISPAARLSILGRSPGFLTMYAISSAGSPPMG